ncbi:MAG: crossover junction endodeoxyribonuclease RuvC [Verrucomicrobiales bacterium]|nr:crossover junction endodeoxyribonuclease RuvC [Verrucomicrobiales bacterium]
MVYPYAKMAVVGITLRQFTQIQARLARKRTCARAPASTDAAPANHAQGKVRRVILGIDPSVRATGYGVILTEKTGPRALAYGTISLRGRDHTRADRLAHIARTLRDVVERHRPEVCVIEGLFYGPNPKTAQAIGEARGAALAIVAEAGIEIFEIAPRRVKLAIVGHGAAHKLAVAKMVQRMLNLSATPEPDAADALALALAFAQEQKGFGPSTLKRI